MTRSYTPLSKLPQFDPRQAPVIRHDHHLPAVEATRLSAQALRQRFARPPEWQPEVVRERRFSAREPALAAVLLPSLHLPRAFMSEPSSDECKAAS